MDCRDLFATLPRLGLKDLRFVDPPVPAWFNDGTSVVRIPTGLSARDTLGTMMHEEMRHGTDEIVDPDYLAKVMNQMPTDDLIEGWPLAETHEATKGVAPSVWAKDPGHAALPKELRANSIEGYGIDPEPFKRLYPGVAKAVRDQLKAHPILSKLVQFNSLAGLGVGLPLAAMLGLEAFGGDWRMATAGFPNSS